MQVKWLLSYCNTQDKCIVSLAGIDFVTVLEAILTSRPSNAWEIAVFVVKNLMSNNFRKTVVLKKRNEL